MTTIACNRDEIVCDLQYTTEGYGKFKGNPKIYEFEPSSIYPTSYFVGFCGTAREMFTVGDFFASPDSYESIPKVETEVAGLILTKDKKIFMFDSGLRWIEVKDQYFAIGSGASFAKGAMASGKTPLEAVRIAMKHDPYTGYGTKVFKFK